MSRADFLSSYGPRLGLHRNERHERIRARGMHSAIEVRSVVLMARVITPKATAIKLPGLPALTLRLAESRAQSGFGRLLHPTNL